MKAEADASLLSSERRAPILADSRAIDMATGFESESPPIDRGCVPVPDFFRYRYLVDKQPISRAS